MTRAARLAVLIGALIPCFPKLMDSLWLDEAVTYWIVKDGGFWDAMRRTIDFPPQSLAYTPIAWAALKIGGAHELALRMPSVAATAFAVYLLYRLVARLVDPETGFIAASLFAYSLGPIVATNARQYALAMLGIIAATLLLVRWLESGRRVLAIGYVLVGTSVMYLQPFYAPIFVLHLVLAWELRAWKGRGLATMLTGIAVLTLPLMWQLSTIANRTAGLSFSRIPAWSGVSLDLVGFGLLAILLAVAQRHLPFRVPIVTLLAWTTGPHLLLVVIAHATGMSVVVARYFAYAGLGFAMSMAVVLRALSPRFRMALSAMVVIPLAVLSFHVNKFENWRAGAEQVAALGLPPDTPILVRSGLPEGRHWYRAPERVPYLMAPLAFYPVPGRPLPLPYNFDAPAVEYLQHDVVPVLSDANHFVIFSHDFEFSGDGRLPLRVWFDARLPDFRSREIWRDRHLSVVVYSRRAAP